MADSSSNLPLLANASAGRDVQANGLFDPMSPASLFGRNWVTSSALTWGYLGGKYRKADGTILEVANGTVALTASATNYIKETDGVVSVTTVAPSGWPSPLAGGAKALYAVVCDASGVNPAAWPTGGYKDYRTTGIGSGSVNAQGVPAGGTAGQFLKKNSGTDYDASWASEPYDIPVHFPSVPTASMKFRFKFARAVTFPANFSGSQFTATANATASTVIDIQKNGSSVGSCTIAAGTMTPTFASSGGAGVSFAAGDVIAFICPASPDATLADPAITLAGTR